jgi:hypothetical protein
MLTMFRSKVPRLFAGFGLMHRTYCTSVPVMESMSADSCDLNLVVTVSAFKKLCRAFFFAPWILPSMSRVKIFNRRLLVVVSISCFNSDGIASLFRSMNPTVLDWYTKTRRSNEMLRFAERMEKGKKRSCRSTLATHSST